MNEQRWTEVEKSLPVDSARPRAQHGMPRPMYYEDLSPYSFTKMRSRAALLNVGWLEPGEQFQTGNTPDDVTAKIALTTLVLRNPMRGIHRCAFCNHENIYEILDGKRILLGMSEVWFPSPTSEIIFVAPSMLLHYVNRHQYLPPADAVQAILALPAKTDEWDTPKGAYRQLVKRYGR
jgi:hypothetical protein